MTDRPLVSFLLPIRHGERFLGETLNSVLDQTLSDWELVAVLDGPNAKSEQILVGYGDARFRIIQIATGVGLPAALNRGLEECRAPYVARIDADDLCAPRRLEVQTSVLERRPRLGVLGSAATLIDGNSRVIGVHKATTGSARVARGLLWRNKLIHSSVMARRSVLHAVGGYNLATGGATDYELWLRLLTITEIDNLPDRLVSYRRHVNQMSLAPMLRRSTLHSINRARRLAAPYVGVTSVGAFARGGVFIAAQLRWEVKRRLRLRQ
jgi:glycosyltransferase involved in cell wall biosynthesis